MLDVRIVSTMERIFPDSRPAAQEPCGLMLRNELFAMQLAVRSDEGISVLPVVSGPLAGRAEVRQVVQVPSETPCYPEPDAFYERTAPGLFPDPMLPVPPCGVPLNGQCGWHSFFITLDGGSEPLESGEWALDIALTDAVSGEAKATVHYTLRVADMLLRPQETLYTCWTYLDCIAQGHHVPMWSEDFWRLTEQYIALGAAYGVNMMLTSLLTPPLETAVGMYRTTVQLVDIAWRDKQWRFGFDRLDRFVAICRRHGIRKFEITHLFSQWGARFAPQVVADTGHGPERVFGWDTPADSPAYAAFLTALLRAFREHAQTGGYWQDCVFHVSDEPGRDDHEAYRRGRDLIVNAIGPVEIMDALSDFAFYTEGLTSTPVPAIDAIEPFAQAGVQPLWGYYCCAQTNLVSNRFFSMPLQRTRAMGLLMYVYNMQGFLHWGFNHYNAQQSRVQIDPFACTDAIRAFPGGDAFSVYPDTDGPAPSLRLNAFAQGLQDERLLRQAETAIGRQAVMDVIAGLFPEKITMTNYPRERAFFDHLRQKLLAVILKERAE